MRGYFSINETADYGRGFEKGKQESSPFEFTLTIRSEDVETLLSDKDHDAPMIGTMTAPALSAYPLMAYNGRFNLFVRDAQDAEKKKMVYNIYLQSREGKKYYFEGFKDVQNNKGLDVWKDTTTLFITVYEENGAGKVLGKGQLIIEPKDFAKQLTTMKAVNTHTKLEQIKAVSSFGKFFAGNVFETYFKKIR
jgi:cholesterol oxidase